MNSKYGNPVGAPDFKPLNAHGHMPKRQKPPDRSTWCVSVEVRATKQRTLTGLIGPIGGAQMLCDAIKKQIELGREKDWADPQIVRIL